MGEGSTDESGDVVGIGLDSADEGLSWCGWDSCWGSQGLEGREDFLKMRSRISLPYVGDRSANEPPAAISRSSAESMSKPV